MSILAGDPLTQLAFAPGDSSKQRRAINLPICKTQIEC